MCVRVCVHVTVCVCVCVCVCVYLSAHSSLTAIHPAIWLLWRLIMHYITKSRYVTSNNTLSFERAVYGLGQLVQVLSCIQIPVQTLRTI